MIRTLQQHAVHKGIDVYMECTLVTPPQGRRPGVRRLRLLARDAASSSLFKAKAVVLATGGIGKAWEFTSNSWEYTGDGVAMALEAGADLIDMECVQFHPTGMVWPPSVRGHPGHRGRARRRRHRSGTRTGERFMFDYIPEFFKKETADTEAEADRWYTDKKNNRRPPDLLPRDEVARAINAEVKAGRGKPARRRLPRHRHPPGRRDHQAPAAVDVPPVQGAGGRRHHHDADGGRPDRATT